MRGRDRILSDARTSAGQTAVDYVALLGVIALVASAVLGASIGGDISESVHQQICRVVATAGVGDCADKNDGDDGDHLGLGVPVESGIVDRGGSAPSDGESGADSKNALPNVCFEPRDRTSHSHVRIPGRGVSGAVTAWGYTMLANYIIDKVDNEKNKEKRVQEALADLAYCLPDYNIVIAQPHEGNLEQMDGAAMIDTVEISGTTYRVYAFKTGKFTWADDADLGWKNRAFHGTFDVSGDRRTVTFSEPPRPQRKKNWKPGDEGCEIEGQDPPDRSRYYDTYSPLHEEASAASVRMLVNDMRRCYPDYNVVAMTSEHSSHWADQPETLVHQGRYRLNSHHNNDADDGDDIASGRGVFDVYVFDKGTFSNDGDGGYTNWAYYGDYTRDGMEVSFQQPEPADLEADPTPTDSEPVDFNDETPKYSGGGPYPGTNYSGEVPHDDAKLTHSLIDEYSRTFPDKNIIAVKSFNDMMFSGVSGVEHLAVVNGVDVFAIGKGTVTNNGDGGWQNWGFSGTFEQDKDDPKVVTFSSQE